MIASARLRRVLAWSVVPPLLVFATLIGRSMSIYPGGTWEERQTPGHSQARNFLCDLTRPIAINGQPNQTGSRYASLALLAFVVALGPFFLITPSLFADRKTLGGVVGICGALSCLGGVGIILVPSYRFGPMLHGVVVLIAALPGLIAALGATLGAWRTATPVRSIRSAASATLVVTAVTVAVFAAQLSRGAETTPGLPVLEKTAIGLAMVWMLLTAATVLRKPSLP